MVLGDIPQQDEWLICMCYCGSITRNIVPMWAWGWSSVVDAGPTSRPHWFNVLCLLALFTYHVSLCGWRNDNNVCWPKDGPTLVNAGPPLGRHCLFEDPRIADLEIDTTVVWIFRVVQCIIQECKIGAIGDTKNYIYKVLGDTHSTNQIESPNCEW